MVAVVQGAHGAEGLAEDVVVGGGHPALIRRGGLLGAETLRSSGNRQTGVRHCRQGQNGGGQGPCGRVAVTQMNHGRRGRQRGESCRSGCAERNPSQARRQSGGPGNLQRADDAVGAR